MKSTAITSIILLSAAICQAVEVEFHDVLPTNAIASMTPSSEVANYFSWRDNDIGQSFLLPENIKVRGIAFKISVTSKALTAFPFSVKVYEAAEPTSVPSESDLKWEENGSLPADLAGEGYLCVIFEKPIIASEGKYYLFMLSQPNSEQTRAIQFPLFLSSASSDAASFTWYRLHDDERSKRYNLRGAEAYLLKGE